MGQSFPLDPTRWRRYYLLGVVSALPAGCWSGLRSIAPADLTPMSPAIVAGWAGELAPRRAMEVHLRWRFENQKGSSGGRAVVRIAPPDTLRFDYRGPFGKSGSAVVVEGRKLWAQPEGDFRSLIPVAPLFWAALGMPTEPPDGAALSGRDGPDRRAWRYAVGDEVLDFILEPEPAGRLLAEMRVGTRIVGVTETQFDTARQPQRATMTFPQDASRFSFTIEAIDTLVVFDAETWKAS
ncbi:MAG TPA: hypothetical protein VGA37_14910 [Gemmatimonadales bacterium]